MSADANRGRTGAQKRRKLRADESDSAEESEEELESNWQNEEEEDEYDELDEDEDDDNAPLVATEVPEDAVIPTMEELNLNAPVRAFLDRLDAPMRRKQLYCLKVANEYDRNVMLGKIFSRELLRNIGPVQLTCASKKTGKDNDGGRQGGGKKDKGKRPASQPTTT